PSSRYAAAWISGDFECAIGAPSTASFAPLGVTSRGSVTIPAALALMRAAPLMESRDVLLVTGLVTRKCGFPALEIHRGEIQPVSVRRMQGGIDGRVPRESDRADRETGVRVGVVGVAGVG